MDNNEKHQEPRNEKKVNRERMAESIAKRLAEKPELLDEIRRRLDEDVVD